MLGLSRWAEHGGSYRTLQRWFSSGLDWGSLLWTVVLVKTHRKTGKRAHVLLFGTDLSLSAVQLVNYYSLRFQIEFNFRDAKQYWGLEDFVNISEPAVHQRRDLD